ncbi:hypothetical protein CK203_102531 [Vitis vinifera]|uniref:Uncharacterized protein n=1 Tax=Vitis vinifera TaxID=29760 RepID=A0A438DVB0_VITVI|nr:hypothetical protein CK203_102531 [Vitis vinifera]
MQGSLRPAMEQVSEECHSSKAPVDLAVKMPQDASNNIVRDTRGLSGFLSQFYSLL